MMKESLTIASLVLCAFLGSAAHAQNAAYSVDDIVKFFNSPENQTTRGICVGSDEECNVGAARKSPAAFDLMINFGKNSAELNDAAMNNLVQFSVALRHPSLASARFAIEGFTDATGSDNHNLVLSDKRARSVAKFLEDLGIDSARLEARGYGETRMRSADANDPVNRRVETHIIK
jgi:outer membrane protein OmpA-like peptidoglycan-associated protein